MMADPHKAVSEITEITVAEDLGGGWHFLASVGWGTLAGTFSFVGFAAIEQEGLPIDILFGGFLIFAFFVSLFIIAAMFLIGLPVTALLKSIGAEEVWLYTTIGATSGFATLAIMFEVWRAPDLLLLPFTAALAGAATGFRWGSWRERRAKEIQAAAQAPEPPENPFHDMIH